MNPRWWPPLAFGGCVASAVADEPAGDVEVLSDVDADGIPDAWEEGVTAFSSTEDDLGSASPTRPDLFVYVDWMQAEDRPSTRPAPETIEQIESWFRAHQIILQLIVADRPVDPLDLSDPLLEQIQRYREAALRSDRRKMLFRYALFGYSHSTSEARGDAFTIPSNAFLVTVQDRYGSDPSRLARAQEATFIHELGHALGLFHHAGANEPQLSPNHISVMNDAIAEHYIDFGAGLPTFQDFTMDSLDEDHLYEREGMRDAPGNRALRTCWYDARRKVRCGIPMGALDWSGDNRIDPSEMDQSVSGDLATDVLPATPDEWDIVSVALSDPAGLGIRIVPVNLSELVGVASPPCLISPPSSESSAELPMLPQPELTGPEPKRPKKPRNRPR